jgi:hypothetical protein
LFHLSTEQLIEYWRAQRGADAIARRSAIDPTHILNLLPRLFILGRRGPGDYQFRLAGDFLSELHDRKLPGTDFLGLWRADGRVSLQMAMEAVRRRGEPMVVACDARTQAATGLRTEIALAPLADGRGDRNRFLGLYQPTSPVIGLAGRPVLNLAVRSIATPDSAEDAFPRLRLATLHGAPAR